MLPLGAIGLVEFVPDQRVLHGITLSWQSYRPADYIAAALDGVVSTAAELSDMARERKGLSHATDTLGLIQSALEELVTSGNEKRVTAVRVRNEQWHRDNENQHRLNKMIVKPDWFTGRIAYSRHDPDAVVRGLVGTASVEALVSSK
ncbi:MAG: hypothetical protein KDA31_07150 [Phycisphaerales bacterium]|nr:hypothetical protein [Phycisphaerales bacterium]MCB9837092.1 hypothetical protein [Phycisphaera sp.]